MFIREQLLEIVKTTPEPQVDSITAAVKGMPFNPAVPYSS